MCYALEAPEIYRRSLRPIEGEDVKYDFRQAPIKRRSRALPNLAPVDNGRRIWIKAGKRRRNGHEAAHGVEVILVNELLCGRRQLVLVGDVLKKGYGAREDAVGDVFGTFVEVFLVYVRRDFGVVRKVLDVVELTLARCVDRSEQMAELHHRAHYPSYGDQDEF